MAWLDLVSFFWLVLASDFSGSSAVKPGGSLRFGLKVFYLLFNPEDSMWDVSNNLETSDE